MSQEKIEISRPMVGFLTIACFVAAPVVHWQWPAEELWFAGFIRVGLLMGALWLALPTRTRPAAWANVSPATFVGLIVAVILLPRYPRLIVPGVGILLACHLFLKPKSRTPPKPRRTS